jgi:hypothetical protein
MSPLRRTFSHCVGCRKSRRIYRFIRQCWIPRSRLVLRHGNAVPGCSRRHLLFGNQDQPLHVPQVHHSAQTMAFVCASSAATIPMTPSVRSTELFRVNSGLLFLWERPSTWTGAPFTFRLYLVGRLERNRAQCCALLLAGDHCHRRVLVPPPVPSSDWS